MTTGGPRSHPLAWRGIRVTLWIIIAALIGGQSVGVWGMCVQERQLCDFGHFYYAAAAWRAGDAGLYDANLASPRLVDDQQFELRNVASPLWHLAVLPFTFVSPGLAFGLWVLCNIAVWTWSLLIAVWLVALREATHANDRLATPVTQAMASPAFSCSADAVI